MHLDKNTFTSIRNSRKVMNSNYRRLFLQVHIIIANLHLNTKSYRQFYAHNNLKR